MTIAAQEFSNTGAWRGVYFDGPQSDQNHDGDEIPVWLVYVGDEQAEPTDTVYKCHNFTSAQALVDHYEANMAEYDIKGTPSIVINGTVHSNMTYAELKTILDAELAK